MELDRIEKIIKLTLNVIFKYKDSLYKEKLQEELSKIQASIDQLIIKELVSAFDELSYAFITDNEETKRIRLNFAEENLLNNTGLNPLLSTGEIPNTRLMAMAHLGLSIISLLRDDNIMSTIHCLRAYEVAPNYARKNLLPEIYTDIFKPKCFDIFVWRSNSKKNIRNINFTSNIIGKKVWGSTLLVLGGLGTVLTLSSRLPANAYAVNCLLGIAGKELDEANVSYFQKQAIKELDVELANKIDQRCQELASKYLLEIKRHKTNS